MRGAARSPSAERPQRVGRGSPLVDRPVCGSGGVPAAAHRPSREQPSLRESCFRLGPPAARCALFRRPTGPSPTSVDSMVCVLGVVRRCGRVGSDSVRRRRCPYFPSGPSGRLRHRSTAWCASSASSVAAGGLVPTLSAVGDVRTSPAAHRVVSDIGRQHGVRPRRRPSLRVGWFRLCLSSAMSVLPQRPIGSSPAAVDSMVCVLGVVRRCGRVGSGSVRRRRCPYFPSGPSGRLRQRSTARCASSASSVAAGGLVPALCAVGDVRTSPAAHRVVSGSGPQHGVRPRRRPSLRVGWFRLCAPSAMSVLPQRPIGSSPTAVHSTVCVLGVVRRCGRVGSGSVRRRRCPYFPSGPSGRLRQRSTARCASSASSVAAGGLVPALCAVGGVRTSPAAHRVVSGSGRQRGVRPRRRPSLREGWFRLCAPSAMSVLPQRPIGSSPAAVDGMVCVLGVVRRCGWVGSGSVRRRRCPYFRSGPSGRLRQRSTARCASSASSVAAGGLVPALCAVGDVRTSPAAHRVVPAAVDSPVCVLGVIGRCGRVGSGSVRRRRCPYFPSGPSGRLRQRSTARCASSASSVAAGGLVPALCAVGDVRTSPAAHRVVSDSGRQHGVRPRRRPSLREGWFRLCPPSAMSVLPQRGRPPRRRVSPTAVDSTERHTRRRPSPQATGWFWQPSTAPSVHHERTQDDRQHGRPAARIPWRLDGRCSSQCHSRAENATECQHGAGPRRAGRVA